jgi:hypothetical protein
LLHCLHATAIRRGSSLAHKNLAAAVEEAAQRLADLAGLDEIGRTPDEVAADDAAERLLGGDDEPDKAGCQPAEGEFGLYTRSQTASRANEAE